MSNEEPTPIRPAPPEEKRRTLPESAVLVPCPRCATICPVIKLESGEEIMVQPTMVRGVITAVENIQSIKPQTPDDLIFKLIARSATGKLSPPVLIPHALVCNPAPLTRGLAPREDSPEEPEAN